MQKPTRRGFHALLLALLFGRPRAHASPPQEHAAEERAGSGKRTEVRRYRADAVILFLGIAIYRRSGVGGGEASVEEVNDGGATRTTLFFGAGSDPKRAHGLSRVGWIQEMARESDAGLNEVDYFGVLTASPEESLAHARKSIAAPHSGSSRYSAVSGRHSQGHSRSALAHFEYPADATWSDPGLIRAAHNLFPHEVAWRETSWTKPPNYIPPTFLLELVRLLKQRARHATGSYVYNEQEYRLDVEAMPQRQDRLVAVRGKVRNPRTGHETAFSLWLPDAPDSVIPVRIEFQARSFLRLTFEAVAA